MTSEVAECRDPSSNPMRACACVRECECLRACVCACACVYAYLCAYMFLRINFYPLATAGLAPAAT